VFVRFDELDIAFRPDDASRSFHVVSIDLYRDRNIAKKTDNAKALTSEE